MIILIGTSFHEDFSVGSTPFHNLQMIAEALAFAAGKPDVEVWHKIHPGEDVAEYTEAQRALGWSPTQYRLFPHQGHVGLWDLFAQATVFVTCWSSTVLEAVLANCPVVVCDMAVARRAHDELTHPMIRYVYDVPTFHRMLQQRYDFWRGPVVEYRHA